MAVFFLLPAAQLDIGVWSARCGEESKYSLETLAANRDQRQAAEILLVGLGQITTGAPRALEHLEQVASFK